MGTYLDVLLLNACLFGALGHQLVTHTEHADREVLSALVHPVLSV